MSDSERGYAEDLRRASLGFFLRSRYAFCLHAGEQVLASERLAVKASPQTSHVFCSLGLRLRWL